MQTSSWTLVVCILISSQWSTVVDTNCNQGWFGDRCQYKCRCQNDDCDLDGSCKSGVTCQGGWFGPECQYADIAYNQSSVAFPVVVDSDDSTCLNNVDSDLIKFDLGQPFSTNWLRIRISKPELLSTLEIKVNVYGELFPYNCYGNATVDRYTMDCYYPISLRVRNINITGQGIRYMCSLYVSGGRSVASTQNAPQRSSFLIHYTHWDVYYSAANSLDGNSEARKTNSCSISEEDVPRWNVSFTHPEIIVMRRTVLYYRDEEANAKTAASNFLHFYLNEIGKSVTLKGVKQFITETIATNNSDNIPNICEVDLYGESVCDPGWYGKDCEHRCNCAKSESCYVGTGGCYSGCAVGFQGENCKQTCFDNTYGKGCATNCSQFCAKNLTNPKSCHYINGSCVFGCVQGYKGLTCQETCPVNTYGKECTTNCSQFCAKNFTNTQSCDIISGTCVLGCMQGYKGLTCQDPDDNKSNLFAIWAVLAVIGGLIVFVPIYVYMRRRGKEEDKLRHININDNNKVDSIQATSGNDSVKLIKKRQLPEIIQQPMTTEQHVSDENEYATLADYELDSASSDNQDKKLPEENSYVEIEENRRNSKVGSSEINDDTGGYSLINNGALSLAVNNQGKTTVILKEKKTTHGSREVDYVSLLDYKLDFAISDNQDEKATVGRSNDVIMEIRRNSEAENSEIHDGTDCNSQTDSSTLSSAVNNQETITAILKEIKTTHGSNEADYVSLLDYKLDLASSDNQDEKSTAERSYDEIM